MNGNNGVEDCNFSVSGRRNSTQVKVPWKEWLNPTDKY